MKSSTITYRPDVDGLRAVAVLSVLFYHLKFDAFSGGFIGVDVFFVISGFLITKIIATDLERRRFSFSQFYSRRVRRLFPALFFTLACSLTAAFWLLTPFHYAQMAESVIYAVVSFSNVLFWVQSGYFDTDAALKPMLHTWSLSVEEQFYLVWPATLFLLVKWLGLVRALGSLVALGAVSLIAAVVVMRVDQSAAFFLTPFRIMEFALGAMLVRMPDREVAPRWLCEVGLLTGLGLILYAAIAFDEATFFPGLASMVPCIGAALVIAFGNQSRAALLLRSRVLVYVGLLSYSLYLCHWPIIVFYRHWSGNAFSSIEQLGLMAASVLVGVFMYHFVEKPFRARRTQSPPRVAPVGFAAAASAIPLIFLAAHVWANNGWSWRLPAELEQLAVVTKQAGEMRREIIKERCPRENRHRCEFRADAMNVVVLGNSHGLDGFNAMATAYPSVNFIGLMRPACAPFHVVNARGEPDAGSDKCKRHMAEVSEFLASHEVDAVVVSSTYSRSTMPRYEELIRFIREEVGATPIVFGNAPQWEIDLHEIVVRFGGFANVDQHAEEFVVENLFGFDPQIEDRVRSAGGVFISKLDFFCPNDQCNVVVPNTGSLVTYDRHHLSKEAAVELGHWIKKRFPQFEDILIHSS